MQKPVTIARDLMIPLGVYPHIKDDATVADAIRAFTGAQIERRGRLSLPRIILVFDNEEQLIGLVRRRDIMRGLLPEFLTGGEQSHPESEFDFPSDVDLNLADLFKSDPRQLLERNAQAAITSVMQPIEGSAPEDAHILDLVKAMVQNECHILAIMDDEHVVGVVRTVEVLNNVRRLLELE